MGSNELNVGMYIIDKDYKMLYMNQNAQELYPEVKVGDVCYRALAGLDSPCAHCPVSNGGEALFYASFRKEWIAAQAASIELPGLGQGYNIQFQVKQRIEGAAEGVDDAIDVEEHLAELNVGDSNECLIGGYCEEGLPVFYVNDKMVQLLGYDSKEEMIAAIDGMVINTVHPDDREQVAKDLGGSYSPGKTFETVCRMPKKDGTWIMTVDKGKVIETKGGRLAIISMCMDMSGFLKRQEELWAKNGELLQKEFLTENMMNNMPSGYHRCEAKEGCPFIFIGKQFEDIVGWTKEEIERDFDNLYHNLVWPEDVGAMTTYNQMLDMIGKGNAYSTDIYRMKKKGGGYRWVLDSTMFVDLGEDSYFQATIADITSFVEAEHDQQRRLEAAMLQVEEANNAKTQFLSSMSHDIRTPMNAIIGMTALASKHLEDQEYIKNCLNKMALASNHLLTLINDVLDISKVESGKMSLNPIVFSLADTVTNLVNIVRQQISGKCQKFDVRVHNIKEEFLFGDELRLNQIFINILSNAVKYTPEGGHISLDLREEFIAGVSDRVRVVYVVEDDGVGMSKEFQQCMYDSFSRANPENHGEVQGTGLGLTISKTMIDLMKGTIECESDLGKGTKFTVTLELPIAEKIMGDLILPPMEVLLADDDEIFLESASNTLRQMGISPECVTNGEDAIKRTVERHAQGNDYPVIIIDWQMPGMNGIETIRQIRAKVGEAVSIIVVSAYEWHDIEAIAKEAGADGFISKPFFPSNVYENMTRILGIHTDIHTSRELDTWGPNVAGMHVLVAEDNDINWEIAEEILNLYHVTSVRAENGQKCIDMLREARDGEYDLVLMDIKMPIMDGYETTLEIRKSESEYIRNIPVVAMTADAFSEDIQRCKDVGMNGHIAKPLNIGNLVAVLEAEYQKK